MSKRLYDLQLTLIFTTVWLVLFEKISPILCLSGLFVSFSAIRLSERFFLGQSYYRRYYFNLFKIIAYFIFLIKEIYISGFSTILKIITGDVHTDIVTINTELKDDFKKSILANSITLTPGTVTLDLKGQELKVLWLDVQTKHPSRAGHIIKGRLERKL